MCGPHVCTEVSVEAPVSCMCWCMRAYLCADLGAWDACPIVPAPLAPAPLPSTHPRGPLKARSTSLPPQLHAPRCSVHQCVLDQEKTKTPGGTPVLVPPAPAHYAVLLAWGVSLPPLPQYAVSPGASGLRLCKGSQVGPPR